MCLARYWYLVNRRRPRRRSRPRLLWMRESRRLPTTLKDRDRGRRRGRFALHGAKKIPGWGHRVRRESAPNLLNRIACAFPAPSGRNVYFGLPRVNPGLSLLAPSGRMTGTEHIQVFRGQEARRAAIQGRAGQETAQHGHKPSATPTQQRERGNPRSPRRS